MQVSVVSDDYGQITKSLNINQSYGSGKSGSANNNSTDKYSLNTAENTKQINDAIQEWKNFCHQQILKGKLDIIA